MSPLAMHQLPHCSPGGRGSRYTSKLGRQFGRQGGLDPWHRGSAMAPSRHQWQQAGVSGSSTALRMRFATMTPSLEKTEEHHMSYQGGTHKPSHHIERRFIAGSTNRRAAYEPGTRVLIRTAAGTPNPYAGRMGEVVESLRM